MSAWPELVLWLLFFWGAVSRTPLLLYVYAVSVIFGALSMLPPQVSGLNIPAQATCGIFLLMKIFLRADNLAVSLRQAVDVRKLGLLGLFAVYCAFTAVILPRLFKGQVMLYSLNSAKAESALAPATANFDQLFYILAAIGMTFAVSAAARFDSFRIHYYRAILWAASGVVLSGIIELTFNTLHISDLLAEFHNATYRSLDNAGIAGVHRVVGFMPEASVYGSMCITFLSFLVFNFNSFEPKARRRLVPALIAGLTAMGLLSTSSTAYVGLFIFLSLYLARLFYGLVLIPVRSSSRLRQAVYVAAATLVLVALLLVFGQFLFAKFHNLLNGILFDKTKSSSYLERSRWTHAGLAAFFKTHGVGVGIGSVRTSNWFINLLASTGVLGVALFFGFIARVAYRSMTVSNPVDRQTAANLFLSLVPQLAMTWISGTTPDPGMWAMSLLGLAYSIRLREQRAKFRQARVGAAGGLALNAGA
jgi:hypothetical protein